MGRNRSSDDSSSRDDRRRQKKSKKQRRRSYSSSSQQKNKKSNNRDNRDQKDKNKKKNKDKKYRSSKQRYSRDRSRSKDKKKQKEKEKEKQKIKKQQEIKKVQKPKNPEKIKSPTPQRKQKQQTEQERQRKIAMRKVKARLLKLNDILDGGDKSDSDSSQDMKAPDISNAIPVKPIVIPPPMPTPPPMPIIPQQQTQNKIALPPLPPPIPNLAKSNSKKQSRWGKTAPPQTQIIPMVTPNPNIKSKQPMSSTQSSSGTNQSRKQQSNSSIPNKKQSQSQQQSNKLSLQPQYSQDLKLSLSQDKSIQHQQPSHLPQNQPHLPTIDQQFIDPLDQYMMQIQNQAAQQIQLPKNNKKKVITYDQVITVQTVPINTAQINNSFSSKQKAQDDQEKFKNMFLSAIEKLHDKDNQKDQPNHQQDENDKGIMLENNDDIQSEIQDFKEENQGELDFFAKQKKMAERKELNNVDHIKIQYQEVKFNLYRQAEQIKNLSYKQIQKYRKQAGDIKVRGKDILNPVFNWYQCGLSDKILSVIQKRNYGKPFPIQAQSLPLIMSGRDVIGIAETGSGKTLSYLLPTLKHIMAQRPVEQGEGPIAIIMTPTRQLARQVYIEAKNFCKMTNIKILAVYGGLGVQGQLADFKKGADLVICTPGRMIDILTLNKGKVTNLKRVTMVVIDQADRMFDLGFEPQITKIIDNARPKKQVVMFSATFPKNVQMMARRILNNPVEIIVGSRGQACRNVQQIVLVLPQTAKFLKLLQILGQWNQKGSILIFVDKQNQVDYLFQQLIKYGYNPLTLHGAMDHDDRQFTIYDFKKGIKTIMIATSVCARGLDIKAICLVVNFKCPNHLQDYIHRIGRTGRAGTKGTAVTFITPEEEQYSIDLIKALQMSQIHPPEQLKKLSQSYLAKVKKGQARKIRNKNLMGSGFKFDQEQQQKVNQIKAALKKQLKSEGLGGFDDSDQEDIQMKKKKQQNIRGRSQQDRIAQALKNPQIKNKLVSQAVKAVSQAMKSNNKLSTQKILQIAIGSMKQSVTKHKVVTSVEDGVQKVTQLINQFQNKGVEGADFFSYDFQINDYPLSARQKACQQTFLKDVQQQTNCSITLRGVYVEPGKKAPIGSRKLYLHIQGQNKYYVTTAYKQIKSLIEEKAYQSMHIGPAPGKYSI